jgi:hypothetical protein
LPRSGGDARKNLIAATSACPWVEDWRDVHKIIKFQYVLEDLSLLFVKDEKGGG